jgi:CoA-binding domain/Bacterial sugar transferase
MLALLAVRSYEERLVQPVRYETTRVLVAALVTLAAVAALTSAIGSGVPRVVLVFLPAVVFGTLLERWAGRYRLSLQRDRGRCLWTIMLVGGRAEVAAMHIQIGREAHRRFRVVGCCLPGDDRSDHPLPPDLPVLGRVADVPAVVRRLEVDALAVLPVEDMDGDALRRVAEGAVGCQTQLLLAPDLAALVEPWGRVRPLDGLPLTHVTGFSGRTGGRCTAPVGHRLCAGLLLLLTLPVLLTVAVGVKTGSRGPVFVREAGECRANAPLGRLQFRTTDAGGSGTTSTGRALQRLQLVDLPHLLDVVRGDAPLRTTGRR